LKVRESAIKSVVVLAVLLAFASVTNTALAQYFPPVLVWSHRDRETSITVYYAEPQRVITIDVSQFEPEQVVRKITLTLKEPVLTASFTIYLLAERPPEVPEPKETALLYFTIRADVILLENVESAVITFAVEKTVVEEKGVNVETIILNRFFEGVWEEMPTKKVDEDEKFLYYEAESPGLSYFGVTEVVPFPKVQLILVIEIIVVAVVVVGIYPIYLYRRRIYLIYLIYLYRRRLRRMRRL